LALAEPPYGDHLTDLLEVWDLFEMWVLDAEVIPTISARAVSGAAKVAQSVSQALIANGRKFYLPRGLNALIRIALEQVVGAAVGARDEPHCVKERPVGVRTEQDFRPSLFHVYRIQAAIAENPAKVAAKNRCLELWHSIVRIALKDRLAEVDASMFDDGIQQFAELRNCVERRLDDLSAGQRSDVEVGFEE
jgi:hypothetical protein